MLKTLVGHIVQQGAYIAYVRAFKGIVFAAAAREMNGAVVVQGQFAFGLCKAHYKGIAKKVALVGRGQGNTIGIK